MKEEIKLRAAPLEIPEKRPDLYWTISNICNQAEGGVWLKKQSCKVLIRVSQNLSGMPIKPGANEIGYTKPGAPIGPQYTGPIDDAMMANILIYG